MVTKFGRMRLTQERSTFLGVKGYEGGIWGQPEINLLAMP